MFKDCVARADIFASPQKSAWFDNACVPTPVDPTKPRQQSTNTNNEYLGPSLFLLERNKKKSFYFFNYSTSISLRTLHALSL